MPQSEIKINLQNTDVSPLQCVFMYRITSKICAIYF